jgi:hypothetical protein
MLKQHQNMCSRRPLRLAWVRHPLDLKTPLSVRTVVQEALLF